MKVLSYKPQSVKNPQGKQKVYFCAHPDDYRLLDEIGKEILTRQSCCVWYDSDPTAECDIQELLSLLSGMQLFVVPVTTKLLTQSSRAMDAEIKFAFEKMIPVLPIMLEEGLDELYARKFGDLQYLSKVSRDPTEIGYGDKLTKYLASVLVGDELASKVRAAFDAYIFLSYRKKDRAKAQELMRLIHKIPFCRDIAIWYDEYLIPGESFNDVIMEALEKSDVFALAVTPSLLEAGNYIAQYEYPKAHTAGKNVLPAELEKTDQAELGDLYDGIPACVNAYNDELREGLAELLKGIALLENDADPEHNYFIGLAYLKGIDVEVSGERAEQLLKAASDAGVTEATRTLEVMYHTGDGVKRDYHTAIEWQKRLAEQLIAVYKKSNAQSDYISAFMELGQRNTIVRHLKLLSVWRTR